MNRVELIGRLTRDIELKYTATQVVVAKFSLAVKRRKKDDPADFINCTAFGKTAETMHKYLGKGRLIGVTGRIQTGSYTTNDGQAKYITDVIVEDFEFLDKGNAIAVEDAPQDEPQDIPDGFEQIEADIPY